MLLYLRSLSANKSISSETAPHARLGSTRERERDDTLDFDDVLVDPLKYVGESECTTGDLAHHEFESRDGIDCQVESVHKKKRVRGCKGYALVPVEKREIVRQRFHESCSFLGDAAVIASLGAEYGGFQQTPVSNIIDSSELIDLLLVDCENFGNREVDALRHLTYFASF